MSQSVGQSVIQSVSQCVYGLYRLGRHSKQTLIVILINNVHRLQF